MSILTAKDVKNIEYSFYELLFDSPGTKEEKQQYFTNRNIQVPKTNYERMLEVLIERLGRAQAGESIFDYVLHSAKPRLKDVLTVAKETGYIELNEDELVIITDLFHNNGNPKRIGELLLYYIEEIDFQWGNKLSEETQPFSRPEEFEYDVALSFAGEDRGYVDQVAHTLIGHGLSVFYDRFEQVDLWGRDLYTHLDDIYRKKAQYCLMFISKYYAKKVWTNHERESAQARALEEQKEYILPVKLDNTEIPGIRPTIGYVDGRKHSPKEIAEMFVEKCH